MVEKLDLPKANQLAQQVRNLRYAIQILEDPNGDIMAMAVGMRQGEDGTMPQFTGPQMVQVDVSDLDYPQQMVTSIVGSFNARIAEITQELENMGVTGIDTPEPTGGPAPPRTTRPVPAAAAAAQQAPPQQARRTTRR